MNFHDLVSQLIVDTKGSPDASFFVLTADSSLRAFLPELILCLAVLAMLGVRLFSWGRFVSASAIALIGAVLALAAAAPWEHLAGVLSAEGAAHPGAVTRMEIFTGMLVYDAFSVFIRSLLFMFLALFVVFTQLTGVPDTEDGPDLYSLVFGATLGMCLMASANHLLTVFMGVEMASVPSYVLAGLMKGRRRASEAALKYSVYGAGAAGVMLYGISLLAGLLNTAHLPTLATRLAERVAANPPQDELVVLGIAGLLIGVGVAFKLSAVPFHFWCPDVFEGATAEVNAFLSIASKAAALALLVRVVLGVGAVAPAGFAPGERTAAALANRPAAAATAGLYNIADEKAAAEPKPAAVVAEAASSEVPPADLQAALAPVRGYLGRLVAFFAVITCTFGNLAAYGQTNLKRLFAYSTIAHAGYMMMAVAAMAELTGLNNASAAKAVAAVGIYLATYLFMNLGAFAFIAFFRNAMRSEELADYAGLIKRYPLTVVCFVAILFSLVGLPPLSGFLGKFAIFSSLVDAYQQSGGKANYLLATLVVGGLNTAISLVYYLRVAKVLAIDPEPEQRTPFAYSDVSLASAYLWLVTLPTVALIVSWDWLSTMALTAAHYLFA